MPTNDQRNNVTRMNRRAFLGILGAGAAGIVENAIVPGFSNPLRVKAADDPLEIGLEAVQETSPILAGNPTRVWRFKGNVLKGDPASLQPVRNSYLGPTFRVKKGQSVKVAFKNSLSEPTIVHWHGLHVPETSDGHPRYAVGANQSYQYEFQVMDRAGIYWYHPHAHMRTAAQVNAGMAGLFIVSDDEEAALNLPSGDYDLPLVIQDRTFDSRNQFVYSGNDMMTQMDGFLGEKILVNGQPDFALDVEARPYRLRFLNGSNSRIYKLGWSDNTPLTVIATDGGLLEAPVQRNYVMLAPGERVELWADFSGRAIGTELTLKSLPFAGDTMMMGTTALPVGAEFDVMRVKVSAEARDKDLPTLPAHLSNMNKLQIADAVNRDSPRRFEIGFRQMTWFINGRTFEMDQVGADAIVKLNTTEVWEFANLPGGMGMMGMGGQMQMMHPMHIHGVQFLVVNRDIAADNRAAWETVSGGLVDDGWKDTVLMSPGERITVLMRFADFPGLYLVHCHNLEHEDMGLMLNYRVEA